MACASRRHGEHMALEGSSVTVRSATRWSGRRRCRAPRLPDRWGGVEQRTRGIWGRVAVHRISPWRGGTTVEGAPAEPARAGDLARHITFSRKVPRDRVYSVCCQPPGRCNKRALSGAARRWNGGSDRRCSDARERLGGTGNLHIRYNRRRSRSDQRGRRRDAQRMGGCRHVAARVA